MLDLMPDSSRLLLAASAIFVRLFACPYKGTFTKYHPFYMPPPTFSINGLP